MSQSKLQVLLCRLRLAPSRGDPVNSYFSIRLFLSSLHVSSFSALCLHVSPFGVLYCLLFFAVYSVLYRYVVCVPLCVRVSRVSRVCPGSPRCLFTGTCCVY